VDWEVSSVELFPDIRLDSTQALFHAFRKNCGRRAVINNFIRKVLAGLCRCLRILFRILSGLGAFQIFILVMACRTFERLVNFGSLAGASHARMSH
jgi:hypothetical protein